MNGTEFDISTPEARDQLPVQVSSYLSYIDDKALPDSMAICVAYTKRVSGGEWHYIIRWGKQEIKESLGKDRRGLGFSHVVQKATAAGLKMSRDAESTDYLQKIMPSQDDVKHFAKYYRVLNGETDWFLTSAYINRAIKTPGYYFDGGCLWLVVGRDRRAFWETWNVPGSDADRVPDEVKRIGSFPKLGLSGARDKAYPGRPVAVLRAAAAERKQQEDERMVRLQNAKQLPPPINPASDAPWAQVMIENEEVTGHAMAARVFELVEPAMKAAIWQAIQEIQEASHAAA